MLVGIINDDVVLLKAPQSHGLLGLVLIMSHVIIWFLVSPYQSHGLSLLARTMSHVMFGFILKPRQSHGLLGLVLIMSHVIIGFLVSPYQHHLYFESLNLSNTRLSISLRMLLLEDIYTSQTFMSMLP
jgi:hypothetical protein